MTAEEASQAIRLANRTSTSWGKLRVKKADSWAATYPQKGSGNFEAEEDMREEGSKGRLHRANGFKTKEGSAR